MMKKIELNLGVGMNMFFPEPVVIEIEDNVEPNVIDLEMVYQKYLEFCKTIDEPDYNYLIEDVNQNMVRTMTFDEFINEWDRNTKFQQKFK